MNNAEISKTISHALRHEPWVYELELDAEGWTPLDDLLDALRKSSPSLADINRNTIENIIASSEKKRFEIDCDRIRALYGHSVPQKLSYIASEPPEVLYHGTTKSIAEMIKKGGLLPMTRQYVHLSPDKKVALEVAKRKGSDVEILSIDARRAFYDGVKFYQGNQHVWLSDNVPSMYIISV